MPPHLLAATVSTPNVPNDTIIWLLVGIIIGGWFFIRIIRK